MIKTYTLYLSYAGFFHLGYLDGMYLKYGGKSILDVSPEEYGTDFNNVLLMQSVIGVLVAIVAGVLRDQIMLAFAFGMVLNNMITCHQMLFQAVGEFRLYSKALNIKPFISLVGSLILLLLLRCESYFPYIVCQLLSAMVPFLYITAILQANIHFLGRGKISKGNYKKNISSGFVLMLGNFSNNILTGIDRWFVKLLMSTTDFAVYSFAVSVDSLVSIFVNPVTITMYHTLCTIKEVEKIREMKRMILLWGCVIMSLAFPAKWIIEHFLDKYLQSVNLIFLLFATQTFYAIIKGVYVNLFKARKRQQTYFWQMLLIIVIATVLNGALFLIFHSRTSIAVATFISALIWLGINERQNPTIAFQGKEWIFLVFLMGVFFTCGTRFEAVSGFLIYIGAAMLLSVFFMRNTALSMVVIGKRFIEAKKNQIIGKKKNNQYEP